MALTLSLTPGVSWAESDPEPTPTASVLKVDALETALTGDDTSEKGSGEVTASPSNTPESKPSASETQTTDPEADKPNDATPDAVDATQTPSTNTTDASQAGITPFFVGTPDGGTAPYVYWIVKDTGGNLVSGATFKFERRSNSQWSAHSSANPFADCASASCSALDRDTDGGEFLLTHYRTNLTDPRKLVNGYNYRVSQAVAPPGYEWVLSGGNAKTIGTDNSDSATWNNGNGTNTHNFGTFEVRKLQTTTYQPLCSAGYVYGISTTGQIRQVAPGGTVTNLGSSASGVSSFNGIGIGSGGSKVYAYERSSNQGETSVSRAAIWEYNTSTGQWTNRNHSINSNASSRTVQFVAGAVNLSTGKYWVGGFSTDGNVFRLWEYDPTTNTSIYKGQVSTPGGSSAAGANNGDIAFNSAGDLFIVRGTGTTTTVFSITAANVAAANGGTIPASQAASVETMNEVNGVAFDSTGKAFLGSNSQLRSYNMPNWSGSNPVVSSGLNSTDLATCSSPPTIVIEKEIIGGRVNSGDQFKLTLNQGTTLLGQATTEGTKVGLQDQRVGPLPTVRNVALSFAEFPAGTTTLSNYASAYQCTVTHADGTVQNLDQVNGTSGSITIPSTGEAVRCVFRNSPLVANVTINKQVTDALGENPAARQGWTVSATTTATTGTATQAPTAVNQATDASGNADWKVTFGALTHRATVNVSETMQDGYEFLNGECTVTGLDGSETETTLTGPAATALTDIKPGDQVNCTYTNKPTPGSITVTKKDATDQSTLAGAVFQLWNDVNGNGTLEPATDTPVGAPQTTPDTGVAEWQDLPLGMYLVQEVTPPPGYDLTIPAVKAFEIKTTDRTLTYAFENPRKPGAITWHKVDSANTSTFLPGSIWTLKGPGHPSEGTEVADCVAGTCNGLDKDPAAGKFKLEDLAWGDYTITETTPPPGYVLNSPPASFTFTVDATNAGTTQTAEGSPFENMRPEGPTLPMTGGFGRDHVYLAGLTMLLLSMAAYGTYRVRGRRNPRGI